MRIAIIDDHTMFLEVLRNALYNVFPDPEIRIYTDGNIFLESLAFSQPPDIVICDLMMPTIGGLKILQELNKLNHLNTKFIVLSMVSDVFAIKECMRHGAAAYLSKEASFEEVSTAIQLVLNGETHITKALNNALLNYVFREDEATIHLSKREKMVLEKICDGETPKEIAFEAGISLNTVQEYVKAIMKKFKVNRTTDMVIFAIQKGLYLPKK